MGTYVKSKDPTKGIEGLLSNLGILYFSFIELGNIFLEFDDWKERYQQLLNKAGDILVERLLQIPVPFCLMCAEKNPTNCHRKFVAEYLTRIGFQIEHLE